MSWAWGFQGDLTAEDNVRLYGAIMGMTGAAEEVKCSADRLGPGKSSKIRGWVLDTTLPENQ